MIKWKNYLLLDLNLILGFQSKIHKVCRASSEGTWHLFTFLQSLNLQRKGGEIRSKAKFIKKVWPAVDEVHFATEWGSSSNKKNRSAFRVWYFRDSRNFNLCHFNIGRFTSSVWNFWRWIADVFLRVSHVVAQANKRRLYSQVCVECVETFLTLRNR